MAKVVMRYNIVHSGRIIIYCALEGPSKKGAGYINYNVATSVDSRKTSMQQNLSCIERPRAWQDMMMLPD